MLPHTGWYWSLSCLLCSSYVLVIWYYATICRFHKGVTWSMNSQANHYIGRFQQNYTKRSDGQIVMFLLCTPKFTQTSIDVDKKKCVYSFEYQPASTSCQTPSIRSERQKYCLAHSPEKRSLVFGPNFCLLVIGTHGCELYGMESKDSRQVG